MSGVRQRRRWGLSQCYRRWQMPRFETCKECAEPFAIEGGHTDPIIDCENIRCPHCKAVNGGDRIADMFRTRKLTRAEEAEYRAKKR